LDTRTSFWDEKGKKINIDSGKLVSKGVKGEEACLMKIKLSVNQGE
jgi:hypothetical protein